MPLEHMPKLPPHELPEAMQLPPTQQPPLAHVGGTPALPDGQQG